MKNSQKFKKKFAKFIKALPKHWLKIISAIVAVVILCLIFRGNYSEIVGTITGYLIAVIGHGIIKAIVDAQEDRHKIASHGFPYNKEFYCKDLTIGDKKTVIWYDALEFEGDPQYDVEDDSKKYFSLDPLLQANFTSIMHAHDASYIANPLMIRLDDFNKDGNKVTLYTSRTAFYNDLVTNRSMDYIFDGSLTVRDIYESNNFLSPLNESKMSNHIGYGVLVFHGDAMLLACRGRNATLSKNKLTAGLAFGLAEQDVITAHDPLNGEPFIERDPVMKTEDLFAGVILVRLADSLNLPLQFIRDCYKNGKIQIHTLGFGQLVYTGGKPQFYFALVIDKDVDLQMANDKKTLKTKRERIDFNKGMAFATGMTLLKNDGYTLKLNLQNSKKVLKGEAEKSFFINYWHLLARPRIDGIPSWVYDIGKI